MYSRQDTQPQTVTGIPHGTPDPPSRPSAPVRPVRAPKSYERSRVARPRSPTRTSRAARRSPSDARPHTQIPSTRHLSTTRRTARTPSATRSATSCTHARDDTRKRRARDALGRAAACSAAAGPSGSRQTHSLIDLRKRGCEGGARATPTCAPLPPTWWTWQWSSRGWEVGKASSFASARATHLDPHMCVFSSKQRRLCFKTASQKTSEKASNRSGPARRAVGQSSTQSRWAAYVNARARWARSRQQPAGWGHQL